MSVTGTATDVRPADLHLAAELAQQLRVDGIRMSTQAGSGHPTSSMSAAELVAVLVTRHLRYNWQDPHHPGNDHLIFSKGHASPLLYAVFRAVGVIDEAEMMTYRRFGSRLQGHPTPVLPWVDVATGSLGQGLPIAVGIALAGKYLDRIPYHVWVLCGDSEMAEGSMWEALDKAAYYGLDNLTAVVDVNRLGQRGPTELEWNLDAYRARVEAFGCRAHCVDGHDVAAVDTAFAACRLGSEGRPTVVLAKTIKGKGFSEVEDRDGWHGRPLPPEMAERAITELGGVRNLRVDSLPAHPDAPATTPDPDAPVTLPRYPRGEVVATRKAYGEAIAALGARAEVVALDGEVSNSTHADEFKKAHPERFFEMFIAEQQMVAAAVGLAVRGYVPFASTFGAFFTRAYDFVRMAGISQVSIRLCGSHAGTEIGADGPSQMALEDLAAMRAVPGSTVLYPADANATARLVARMASLEGISYLRTTRGAYPVIYDADEDFVVGGSKTVLHHDTDEVVLVGAGVTVYTCLEAARRLEAEGIAARVLDLYSVKPVDVDGLRRAAAATGGRLVVVEDHYPQGGLGAAVAEALCEDGQSLRLAHLAVRGLPGSGTSAELMEAAGIGVDAVVAAARRLARE